MCRYEDHSGRVFHLTRFTCNLEAILARHGHVQQQQVGIQLVGKAQGGIAIAGSAEAWARLVAIFHGLPIVGVGKHKAIVFLARGQLDGHPAR